MNPTTTILYSPGRDGRMVIIIKRHTGLMKPNLPKV